MSSESPAAEKGPIDQATTVAMALYSVEVPHTLMRGSAWINSAKSIVLFLVGTIGFSFARAFNVHLSGGGPTSTTFVWFTAFCILAISAGVAFRHPNFAEVRIDLFRLSSLLMAGLILSTFLVGLISLWRVPANWFPPEYGMAWVGELVAFSIASIAAFSLVAYWSRSRRSATDWHKVPNKAAWFTFYCVVNVAMLFLVAH